MDFKVTNTGFYGQYGGAFIPEVLRDNIEELRNHYQEILGDSNFQKTFKSLLRHYAGRPTPLYHARNFSKKYNSTILFKREDLCHTGAHKINNAIGQILIAKTLKKKRIIAETGAGQHGVAVATVCAMSSIECIIYMGEIDIKRQAPNVARMRMLGAKIVPARSGSKTLKDATNEAIRDWINHAKDTYYIIGSVVGPHPYPDIVAKLQSVISKEIQEQLQASWQRNMPDMLIACVGGGSNAAGAFYQFLTDKNVKLVAAEAAGEGVNSGKTAATTYCGSPGILHGSKTLLMQSDDGQIIEPHSISAGLDYPGIGPLFAHIKEIGRASFIPITDKEALDGAFLCSKYEGIIPALETAHAIAVLEKVNCQNQCIVVNISGRGDKDMEAYMNVINQIQQ